MEITLLSQSLQRLGRTVTPNPQDVEQRENLPICWGADLRSITLFEAFIAFIAFNAFNAFNALQIGRLSELYYCIMKYKTF